MIVDLTMTLMNRTAVYDIGREIAHVSASRNFRYWRSYFPFILPFKSLPATSLLGKALGRLAVADLSSPDGTRWKRPAGPMIFVDPLFSLKTIVRPEDIVVCHDIAPVTNPEYFDPNAGELYDRVYLRIQAARPRLVFVSAFTRRAFLDRYPADYPQSEVAPLFFKPRLAVGGPPEQTPRARPYFLMVGGLERRKNYMAAVDAFEKSGLADKGYELVIVGPRGNLSNVFLSRIAGATHVCHLGYATDAQLAGLYRGAVALFFPSLIEGFGVPAIEAPNLGTLPIISRGGVLEEVVGPHGMLVDPGSVDDMARALVSVASMTPERRRDAAEHIRQHQIQYSLENFHMNWRRIIQYQSKICENAI
jgi:glycosyltransferase involved in cell wall biosynthesis